MTSARWFRALLVLLLLLGQYAGHAHALSHLADPPPAREGAPVDGAKVCELCLLSGHLADALVAPAFALRVPSPELLQSLWLAADHSPRLQRAFRSRAPPTAH